MEYDGELKDGLFDHTRMGHSSGSFEELDGKGLLRSESSDHVSAHILLSDDAQDETEAMKG